MTHLKRIKPLYMFLAICLIAVFSAAIFILLDKESTSNSSAINSWEACTAAGYPIQESYPSVCVTPDGKSFVNPNESLKSEDKNSRVPGSWCPSNPRMEAPCFSGYSDDNHPAMYTFTANPE